ncbi:MAG: hypothetical protein QM604_05225, partial [Microbacterium sp.]
AARPLTEKGALAKQHLRGIDVYARRTQLLDRATLSDPLLPYAVLSADPRRAGRAVASAVAHELGGENAITAWRTRDFLSWPRLVTRVAATSIVAVTIVIVIVAPNPYARSSTVDDWDFDAAGTLYTVVDAVDVDATLSRQDDAAQLRVTESIEVTFDDDAAQVPQFAQMWAAETDGQDLGLTVSAVRVDGADVSFATERVRDRLELTTRISQVLTGAHTVEVDYVLADPITAGRGSAVSGREGQVVDRMRWAALLEGWDSGWAYPSEPDVTVSFTVADDVAELASSAGWLRADTDGADGAGDWPDSVFAFGQAEAELDPTSADGEADAEVGQLSETTERTQTGTTHVLSVIGGEYGYPTDSLFSDLGVMLEFPAGTFDGPDAASLRTWETYRSLPIVVVWAMTGIAAAAAVAGVVRATRRGRRTGPGTLRDVVWLLGPAASIASIAVFVWASADMPAEAPEFPPLILGAATALVCAVTGWIAIRPRRATVAASRAMRGRARR